MPKIAVYGTLRARQGNHGVIGRYSPLFLGMHVATGYTMLNTGGFPAIVPSASDEGMVITEVYDVSDEAFRACDRLEGYNPTMPERGMYNRVIIDTMYGPAWIYTWNGRTTGMPVIPSGDWLRRNDVMYQEEEQ